MAAAKFTQKIDEPLDYYAKTPSSEVGEFAHAGAQLADLNAKTFSESRRTGDGAAK